MKLKNKKLVLFSIACCGMSMTLITSCNSKKELKLQNVKIEKVSEQLGNIIDETNKEIEISIEQKETAKKPEIALEYFYSTKTDVIKTFSRDNVAIYKDSIVQAFTYLTDFIFFEGEFEEIKFKDLTTDEKAIAITTYVEIDEYINELYPSYKDELGAEYDMVREFFINLSEFDETEKLEELIESVNKNTSDASYSAKRKTKNY